MGPAVTDLVAAAFTESTVVDNRCAIQLVRIPHV